TKIGYILYFFNFCFSRIWQNTKVGNFKQRNFGMFGFFIPAIITLFLVYCYLKLLLFFNVEVLKLIHIVPIFLFFLFHYFVYLDFFSVLFIDGFLHSAFHINVDYKGIFFKD
ncbi:hypothetical protein, partial [Campylobacter helveticus]|uniref:hypothetical protein n=2 Tax=Campylobacter helveticus TaxID=28898 RepID=UPI00196B1D63